MGHEDASNESLMARYQARLDEGAFARLVERFLGPAHGLAQQLLGDRALAEDAVQETFLRLVRRRERYDPSQPFAPWFYTVLRNVCTDLLRRRAREAQAMAAASQEGAVCEAPRMLPGDALELLGRLGTEDRAVLELRVVHGLSLREAAAALGISEEAAKKRAQRALRRLREEIGRASCRERVFSTV